MIKVKDGFHEEGHTGLNRLHMAWCDIVWQIQRLKESGNPVLLGAVKPSARGLGGKAVPPTFWQRAAT